MMRQTIGAPQTADRTLSGYAVVFVLRVAPADVGKGPQAATREVDWPGDRARILRETALETRGRMVAGEVLVPAAVDPGRRFSLATDAAPEPFHIDIPEDSESPEAGLADLIGTVSSWIVQETLKALHAG